MKVIIKNIIGTVLCVAIFTSCGSDSATIIGNEQLVTQNISINEFHTLELKGNFEVEISYASQTKIDVIAESNIYDALDITNSNGILDVSAKNMITLEPNEDIKIVIQTPSIDKIITKGASSITFKDQIASNDAFSFENSGTTAAEINIKSNKVIVTNSGAGAITISGQTNDAEFTSSGAANIDAGKLIALNTYVKLSGAGNATVYASKYLNATVTGVGNISYLGNPLKIDKKINGLGNIAAE